MFITKQTHAKVIPDNLQELIINTEQLSTELKVRIQIRCDAGHEHVFFVHFADRVL